MRPKNLASVEQARLLEMLMELANIRDDSASFERFARRWPFFAQINDDTPPADNYVVYPTIFKGLSYGKPPAEMPVDIPKKFVLMWQMREAVREIWHGNSDKVTEVLLPSLDDLFGDPDPEGTWPPQLKVDWQRGEFVYKPRSEFQRAVHELFRRSPFVKVCANPDCPTPYFIAHKKAQRYCEGACAKIFQRESKRRWWEEYGNEWRRKKSGGKRGKR